MTIFSKTFALVTPVKTLGIRIRLYPNLSNTCLLSDLGKRNTLCGCVNNPIHTQIITSTMAGCCIFRPVFGCGTLQMLVEILIFNVFNDKKLKKEKRAF